ncbi:ExbD/TolR family protein [Fusobacterium russii]|uniref:ExbD/TolR family protein n=1 Tax=Fusobacterium russii TaxID=854 RepID=UPI0003A6E26B|nr:biopolymer transporter ExbD [Fusobacterium russii]
MKLERIKRRSSGSLILEMTPLIDVVFLLLIFFMLATTFDESTAFKIELPKTTVKKSLKSIKEIQILIDKEKNIYLKYNLNSKINQEKINEKNFVSILTEKLKESENRSVIISADKSIDYGYVVELMGLIKESGAEAINIDTVIKR